MKRMKSLGVWNLVRLFLSVVILVGAGIGLYYLFISDGHIYYSGQEVFATEQDYSNFKSEFIREDVWLVEAEVLSSEPPIVVTYKAELDSFDTVFPYSGNIDILGFWDRGMSGLASFGMICLMVCVAYFFFVGGILWGGLWDND